MWFTEISVKFKVDVLSANIGRVFSRTFTGSTTVFHDGPRCGSDVYSISFCDFFTSLIRSVSCSLRLFEVSTQEIIQKISASVS